MLALLAGVVVALSWCPSTLCAESDKTDKADDAIDAFKAGLDEVDGDIEELRKLLEIGEESGTRDGEKNAPALKRKISFHYVTKFGEAKGPLPKLPWKRKWSKTQNSSIPPPASGERDVYWVMRHYYEVDGYNNDLLYDQPYLHMVRAKKGESPDAATQRVLAKYQKDGSKGGDLHEAFMYDTSQKHLRGGGGSLTVLKLEKIAGPFDNAHEACQPIANYYAGKGLYEIAEMYRDQNSEYYLKAYWDNPKPDDQMYYVFWEYE